MRSIPPLALVLFAGCLGAHATGLQLTFDEIPPAVKSAFMMNYQSVAIRSITCETKGTQDYYTLTYIDTEKAKHTVVLNEGGDQINAY